MIHVCPSPGILLQPNIPKPLHGLNPRSVLGKDWWDWQRHEAYKKFGFRCWACGVHQWRAEYHRWLEGHESYRIDYGRGRAEMIEVQAIKSLFSSCGLALSTHARRSSHVVGDR